jgi:leucyl-tRNA synthetase
VAATDLPVLLPEIDNNTDLLKSGRPLANVEAFEKNKDLKCPCCGSSDVRREIDTLDTFMDSSWYFLRFLQQLDSTIVDTEVMRDWMPVDVYVGGMEHAIMHLLYARFVYKFICDWKGI